MKNLHHLFLFLVMQVVLVIAVKNNNVTRGPFRIVLASVRHCQNSTYPQKKESPIQINLTMIKPGSSRFPLLSANVTVLKDTKQVKLKIKSLIWTGGKWKQSLSLSDISCKGLLLHTILRFISFTLFDTTKCIFLKGNYHLNGMDIDTMHHMFASKMEYGQTLWRNEIIMGFSTYQCWDFLTIIERI